MKTFKKVVRKYNESMEKSNEELGKKVYKKQ